MKLINIRVVSRNIRQKLNNKASFNKDCENEFYDKQNAYCIWFQNRLCLLWEENIVHRHPAQSVYDDLLLENNNSISTAMVDNNSIRKSLSQQQCNHFLV